mgnify:CR=1 FL=1
MALSDHGQYSGVVDIARNGIHEVIRLQTQAKQDDALLQAALDALTCTGESDDPGHRCGHCDDYVDRNGQVRAALRARLESKQEDIIAMARDANPEHDLTAMLPFLSRFAALAAAREREKCATECESLSHRSRWVRAGINGAPMETCQYAAAIRARLEGKP